MARAFSVTTPPPPSPLCKMGLGKLLEERTMQFLKIIGVGGGGGGGGGESK